ncbi:MAG: hypothetical protein GX444_20160 [Myxococcales bacterium]|nr:hypothetical protein [Myxococcales bacterium]
MRRTVLILFCLALASGIAWRSVAAARADDDPALLAKAQAYDTGVRDRHVPGYGGIVQALYETEDLQTILMYRGQGDSTMWTSTYGASQAFRYAVTGDADAKANAIAAVQTLNDHLRVTQTTGYVGRYVGPVSDPAFWLDYAGSEILLYGSGLWLGTFYLSNSSSDQYDGFFHGLSVIYDLVDDAPTRALIKSMIKEVIDKLRASYWFILNEDGLPTTAAPQIDGTERIAFALIAAHILDTEEYWNLYAQVYEEEKPGLPLSAISFFNKYTEYFANNLRHQNFYTLFTMDPDDERVAYFFRVFMDKVRPWVENTHNVYFDWVYLTACQRLDRCRGSQAIMEDGVAMLGQFTEPPNREIHIDPPAAAVDPISQWLVDFQSTLPDWLGDLLDFQLQAKEAYPVEYRCRQEYLWQRSPFQMQCAGFLPQHVMPGVDYLMAYWMGRYYDYLEPHDIDGPPDDDTTDDDNDDNDDNDDTAGTDDDTRTDDDTTLPPDDDTSGNAEDNDDDYGDTCCGI